MEERRGEIRNIGKKCTRERVNRRKWLSISRRRRWLVWWWGIRALHPTVDWSWHAGCRWWGFPGRTGRTRNRRRWSSETRRQIGRVRRRRRWRVCRWWIRRSYSLVDSPTATGRGVSKGDCPVLRGLESIGDKQGDAGSTLSTWQDYHGRVDLESGCQHSWERKHGRSRLLQEYARPSFFQEHPEQDRGRPGVSPLVFKGRRYLESDFVHWPWKWQTQPDLAILRQKTWSAGSSAQVCESIKHQSEAAESGGSWGKQGKQRRRGWVLWARRVLWWRRRN